MRVVIEENEKWRETRTIMKQLSVELRLTVFKMHADVDTTTHVHKYNKSRAKVITSIRRI